MIHGRCLGLAGPGFVAAIALLALSGGGCGGDKVSGQMAAQISPEMEKKTNEMLHDYGKNYNEQFRAQAKAKKKR